MLLREFFEVSQGLIQFGNASMVAVMGVIGPSHSLDAPGERPNRRQSVRPTATIPMTTSAGTATASHATPSMTETRMSRVIAVMPVVTTRIRSRMIGMPSRVREETV